MAFWVLGNKAVNINPVGPDFDSEKEKVISTAKIIVSQVSNRTAGMAMVFLI